MLLPALSKAREKARTASCKNNQKQALLYIHMYLNDYENTLFNMYSDGDWKAVGWWTLYNNKYLTNLKLLSCPQMPNGKMEASAYSNWSSDRNHAFTYCRWRTYGLLSVADTDPYAIVTALNDGIPVATWTSDVGFRGIFYSKVRNTSAFPVVCDTYSPWGGGYSVLNFDSHSGSINSCPSLRHNDAAVIAFADGHVEEYRLGDFYKLKQRCTDTGANCWSFDVANTDGKSLIRKFN